LQRVVIDDADRDLLAPDALADGGEVHAVRGAGLEGDDVAIDAVQSLERRLVALRPGEHALLRRIAPAGVAPYLGLVAQAAHRRVEHLDEEIRGELGIDAAARADEMHLRLL